MTDFLRLFENDWCPLKALVSYLPNGPNAMLGGRGPRTESRDFLHLFESDTEKTIMYLQREGFEDSHIDSAIRLGGRKYGAWVANVVFRQGHEIVPAYGTDEYESAVRDRLQRAKNIIERVFDQRPRPALPSQPHEQLDLNYWEDRLIELNYMLDWARGSQRGQGGLEARGVDLGNMSWEEALQGAKEWHEHLEKRADEEGTKYYRTKGREEVFMTFDDGWYWLDLKASEHKEIGDMLHCCGEGQHTLFALFEPMSSAHVGKVGRPIILMDIDEYTDMAAQTSADGNKQPSHDLWHYVVEAWSKLGIKRVIETTPYGTGMSYSELGVKFLDEYEAKTGIHLEPSSGVGFSQQDLDEATSVVDLFNRSQPFMYLNFSEEHRDGDGEEYSLLNFYGTLSVQFPDWLTDIEFDEVSRGFINLTEDHVSEGKIDLDIDSEWCAYSGESGDYLYASYEWYAKDAVATVVNDFKEIAHDIHDIMQESASNYFDLLEEQLAVNDLPEDHRLFEFIQVRAMDKPKPLIDPNLDSDSTEYWEQYKEGLMIARIKYDVENPDESVVSMGKYSAKPTDHRYWQDVYQKLAQKDPAESQRYSESVVKFLHLFETRGLDFPLDDPEVEQDTSVRPR